MNLTLENLQTVLILYIAFRIKHFICDFGLQTNWIAFNKGKIGKNGAKALFIHAGSHGIGTAIIAYFLAPAYLWLGLFDFLFHGFVDFMKGRATAWAGWDIQDRGFWLSLGLDQEAHNYTHLLYVVIIVLGWNI